MKLEDLVTSDAWIYLATTGAGAGAQDLLWNVPGASAFLAGAHLPYSGRALERFLGYKPEQSVCEATAIDMAIASFMIACQGCPAGRVPVGVGCTASVATLKDHRGAHRSWVAVLRGYDQLWVEHEDHPKVGPSARAVDGERVDQQILECLLGVVMGEGGGADAALLPRILERPLFRANGKREPMPTGALELLPGAFNPFHPGHAENISRSTILSLALRTLHKPDVSVVEALKRVAAINAAGYDVLIESESQLYLDKARKWPGSTFYIGADSLQAMLDPKWYGGRDVDDVLEELDDLNTQFRVAPRSGYPEPRDMLEVVHMPARRMFTVLDTGIYRDISSTQLRGEKP